MKANMSWADRFALIDHFKPTDEQILTAFGLSVDELSTVRNMREAGTFAPNLQLDVAKYSGIFTGQPQPSTVAVTTGATVTRPTSKGNATTHTRPESASKKVKEPQKRGRKGDKIQRALQAVPTSPVPIEAFMAQHGVSLAVLRQSKRFLEKMPADVQAAIGRINVRQDKNTKTLTIWREVPSA